MLKILLTEAEGDTLLLGELDVEDTAFMSVWDYAGDEDFNATHHIFLTTDAVYILTFNVHEFFKQKSKCIGKYDANRECNALF